MNENSIDWKATFEIFESLSVIIAAIVALYGIDSWRREVKWKRRYELAEETLSLFYEIQDVISVIRSPMSTSNEGKTRKRDENESEEDAELLDQAFTVIERYEKHKEPFHKLRAIKYRFITVFGRESEKPFNDVIDLINKIIRASNILGRRYWNDKGRGHLTEKQYLKHLEKREEYENIIWEDYEDDKITTELREIIGSVEFICNIALVKK